jgi:hypothetical protein
VDVASLALNGAQVTALLEVVRQISEGTITKEAATLVITSAFPTIPEEVASRMADGAIAKPIEEPAPIETAPPTDNQEAQP